MDLYIEWGLVVPNRNGSVAARIRTASAVVALSCLVLVAPRAARAVVGPDEIAAVVAKVGGSVVRVITVRPASHEQDKSGAKTVSDTPDERASTAIGSGFIIDPAGYIATNKHVVEGATSVFVVTSDGVRYCASITGMPDKADMALLRIEAGRKLPAVGFGDSDKMRVGEKVIAIGSPFGFDSSVTTGVVSAVNRDIMESPFDDYLQTDAAINHGNSGGPLFNLAGEVIGMNSVIFAPTAGSAGVGFAVPSNDLQFVFGRLMKTGAIRAGMLPIHTQPVTWMLQQALDAPDLRGAMVTSIQDDNDKMLEGKVQPGDVIRTFNGQNVQDPRDLARKAAQAEIGSVATLEIFRENALETVAVTVQAWPEAKPIVLNDDGPRSLGLQLAEGRGKNDNRVVTVASVDATGTAADSGIQKDDVILQVQRTLVSEPDQALRLFWVQSSLRRHFAAVLLERDGKHFWMSLAIPN
jgi:serine protease Do